MASKSRFLALNKRADFLSLKAEGRVFHVNSWLLLNWRKTTGNEIRCGWTIPSHVGSAVLRNKLKRWGREFVRKWSASAGPPGVEMNLVFKRKQGGFYRELSHEEYNEAMGKAVAKLR